MQKLPRFSRVNPLSVEIAGAAALSGVAELFDLTGPGFDDYEHGETCPVSGRADRTTVAYHSIVW